MYAGGDAVAPFGSAWLYVLERGARGCSTPLAPARGPRCRTRFELSCTRVVTNSSWHVVARHSTLCQDTVQDTLLWLHPCGPTVDRLRRSTVGSGTREDVVTAYEMTVLSEDVYIAPVPAVIAAPALAALQHLRHRTSPCRVRSICASGGILCASSCSVDELFSGCRAERRAAR